MTPADAPDLLLGDAVRLRAPRPSDTAALEEMHRDAELVRLSSPGTPYPAMGEQARKLLDEPTSAHRSHFVIASIEDDAPLGVCGLVGYRLQMPDGFLYISLGPDHRGVGYGRDAVRVLLRFGFDGLGLHRISLGVFAFNTRALHVYRELGFTEEGRIRDHWFRDGAWHDDVRMAILAEEWRTARDR